MDQFLMLFFKLLYSGFELFRFLVSTLHVFECTRQLFDLQLLIVHCDSFHRQVINSCIMLFYSVIKL